MLRVLLNALIRIGADLTGMRQTKCAEGRQPLGQEILDETFTQDELRFLNEPHLRNVERKQDPGKLCENNQLLNEFRKFLRASES